MKLELNLVSTRNAFGNYFGLITRKRVLCESDLNEVTKQCVTLLGENISTLETSGASPELISSINSGDLSLSDLLSAKYVLTTVGLDLLVYAVDEAMTENEDSIPADSYEFIIVDNNDVKAGFVRQVKKINYTHDSFSRVEGLKRVAEEDELFSKRVIAKDVVLAPQLELMEQSEQLTGRIPEGISGFVDSIFHYVGKDFIVIGNR